MSLIQISKDPKNKKSSLDEVSRPFSIVVIDKFFLLGAVAGLFGSLFLGVYVWLMRSSLINPDVRYHSLRSWHATMQFYLFLTPFILGFLLQSGSKLLEVHKPLPQLSVIILPLTIAGALLMLFAGNSWPGAALISCACLFAALQLLSGFFQSPLLVKLRFGIPAISGLLSLSFGAFFDLGYTPYSVALFWLGIAAIVFATAQQFISGIFKGARRGAPAFTLFLTFYFLSASTLLLSIFSNSDLWQLTSALMLLSVFSFLYCTDARVVLRNLSTPIGFAFFSAHIWALIGSALLFKGEVYLDPVLHAWGIGYAVTLVIAVSLRLISWVSDQQVISPRSALLILYLWQMAAFVRTFHVLLPLGREIVWAGSAFAVITLTIWGFAVSSEAFRMIRKQFAAYRKTGVLTFNKQG